MFLRFRFPHSWAALILSLSSVLASSPASAAVLYNETWASQFTADNSATIFGWGTFTTNGAINTAVTAGNNTANASFPRLSPLQENIATPYPGTTAGTTTTTPDLARGYIYVGNSNAPQFQWTNEYLTFGNAAGVDPIAGPVSFQFSLGNNAVNKLGRLAIQLENTSWFATNATYTSGAFPIANLGANPQAAVPTFTVDYATTASLWRDLNFNGSMAIDPTDGRGTATAGTTLALAAAARSVDLPAGKITAWGLYWEPDGNTGGNRRADNFMVLQEAPAVPPTRFLTWNNVPGGGDGIAWDIGNNQNWNSASPTNPFRYLENDAVTFNDTNNNHYTVTLNSTVKPGGVTVNTTGTYTIQGTGSIAGGHGLTLTAGTLNLLTNNSFSGETVVSAGTLVLGNGGTTGTAGTKGITNNGTIVINRNNALTLVNTITGTGSLLHNGTGTTTLSGANSYAGGLTVNSGAVRLMSTTAGGTGTITLNPNTTAVFGAPATNALSLNGATVGVTGASPLNGNITAGAATNSTLYLADALNLPTAAGDVIEVAFTQALHGSGNITVLSNGQDNNPDGGNGFRLRGTLPGTYSGRLTLGHNIKGELQTVTAAPAVFSPAGTGTVVLTSGDATLGNSVNAATTTTGYSELNLRNNTLATETVRDVVFGNNVEVTGAGIALLNLLSDTNAPEGTKVTMGSLKIGANQEMAIYKGGTGPAYTVEFPSVTLSGNATFSPRKPGFGAANAVGGDLILNNIGESNAGSGITMAGLRTLTITGTNTYTGPTNIESGNVVLTGSLATTGNVNLNSSIGSATLTGTGSMGNLTVAGNSTVSPGTTAAPIGALAMQSLLANAGTFNLQISGANADRLNVTGNASLAGSTVAIALPIPVTPGTYTLIAAGSVSGLPTLARPNIGRANFALAQAGGNVNVTVTGTAASLRWDNTGGSPMGDGVTWDTQNNRNWRSTVSEQFFEADQVLFNDANNGQYTVNIAGTVIPGSITVANETANYMFGGGEIGGTTSLVKNGAGTLTLNNGGTFTGGVVLNQGTLSIGNAGIAGNGPLGTGTLTLNGGNLDAPSDITLGAANPQIWAGNFGFTGTANLNMGTGAVTLNAANPVVTVAANTLTIGGVISNGTGNSLTKAGVGTLALAGNSNYTGTTTVNAGTLRVTNNGSVGALTGGAVTVASGGAIDLAGNATANNANFGQKQFVVQGTGVGGMGALLNSGTAAQQNAFQRVALTGDALFNAIQRFDIRAGQVNSQNVAILDLAGHTLTKIGTQHFGVVNTDVTAGDIVINEGLFAFEGTTRMLAAQNPLTNQPSKVTINDNATFQVFASGANSMTITRPIITNGDSLQTNNVFFRNNTGVEATIASPVTMRSNVTFNASAAGALLRMSGDFTEEGGARSLIKESANTVILAGSMNYTGTTNINEGTLQIGASDRINDAVKLVLGGAAAGRTFSTGGFNETLNTLEVQNVGTLDFGNGASSLRFANSSAVTWASTLAIVNWTAGSDHLFFGASAAGLTTDQLNLITFVGRNPGSRILATGEVLPVPSLLLGDFSQDGHFDAADIPAAMAALTNLTSFQTGLGLTNAEFLQIADVNGSTAVTNADLQSLLSALIAGNGSAAPVPEPATVVLLALGGFALMVRRTSLRRTA